MAFTDDFSNNPSTALTVGTNASLTFGKVSPKNPVPGLTKYSVAAVAATAPMTMTFAHTERKTTGLRFASSTNAVSPVIVDYHTASVSKVAATPTLGYADPEFKLLYGASLQVWIPRLGADSPSNQTMMDMALRLMVHLNPSSLAGFTKFLNGEG